jgi:hypothetical protein
VTLLIREEVSAMLYDQPAIADVNACTGEHPEYCRACFECPCLPGSLSTIGTVRGATRIAWQYEPNRAEHGVG